MAKVLIVDDSTSSRREVKGIVDELGHTTLEAPNGKDALDLATANPDIELILTDLYMPVMDGIKMCEKLVESGHEAKIVVISSDNNEELQAKAESLNIIAWVVKPITKDVLSAGIQGILG